MKNYVIIDAEAIQKRIEEIELYEGSAFNEDLKQILSQSTPLIPELDKAYEAGKLDEELRQVFDNPKGRYLNNINLDI